MEPAKVKAELRRLVGWLDQNPTSDWPSRLRTAAALLRRHDHEPNIVTAISLDLGEWAKEMETPPLPTVLRDAHYVIEQLEHTLDFLQGLTIPEMRDIFLEEIETLRGIAFGLILYEWQGVVEWPFVSIGEWPFVSIGEWPFRDPHITEVLKLLSTKSSGV